jgi:uncharacterized protein
MSINKQLVQLFIRSLLLLTSVILLGFAVMHIYFYYSEASKFRSQFRDWQMPEDYDFGFKKKYETGFVKSRKDGELNYILFNEPKHKKVIFYFQEIHGNLAYAEQFSSAFEGYEADFFVYDYRGFGKSKGETTQQAFYDDASTVFNWLAKRYNPDSIFIVGFRDGCTMATHLAGTTNVNKAILVNPTFSLKNPDYKTPPRPWYLPDFKQFDFRTDLLIKDVKQPVYLFNGSKDKLEATGRALIKEASPKLVQQTDIEGVEYVGVFVDEGFKKRMKELMK